MTDTSPRATVAVIGGGYGGIAVAKALDAHTDVVLIEPKDAFQHNVAALRALVEPSWVERTFYPYDTLLAHGRVVRDRAVAVADGEVRLASGDVLHPDYVVLATGSAYPFPAKSDHVEVGKAAAHYQAAYDTLVKAQRVMLLGAGAVGIEFAGEIAAVWPDKEIILVDSAADLLPGDYDPRVRAEVHRQLDGLGVRRVLGSPLTALPPIPAGEAGAFTVTTVAGETVEADLWFQCFGAAPRTDYLDESLATARTADGYLQIGPDLRVAGADRVYAIGDIVDGQASRAGVAARHAGIVAENISARVAGTDTVTVLESGPIMIVLPIGPNGGTGQLPNVDGPVPAETIAQFKGRDMMVDRFAGLFAPAVPAAESVS